MQEINSLYIQALAVLLDEENPSISTIQRKLSIGYSHARKIVEWLEDNGYQIKFTRYVNNEKQSL